MLIKMLKNHTVELPDGSAGVFVAGKEFDLNADLAERIIQKGNAKRLG